MTIQHAASAFLGGAVAALVIGLALGAGSRPAEARSETEGAKIVVVPCDRRLPRAALGDASGEDGTFAVHEFPGKSAADLARVRVLSRLRDVQSSHATYTENAPVLLRDGVVIVACDGQRGGAVAPSGSPAIESVLLVLPE